MKKKLKIICLHGFGTNKEFMKMQFTPIEKELQQIAQLYYVDGPFIVPQELVFDRSVFKYIENSPRTWLGPTLNKTRSHQDVVGILEQVRNQIQQFGTSFDGVIGFSQGGILFQFILFYHSLGLIKWNWVKKLKFFLNFSSIPLKLNDSEMVKHLPFKIPSLHFISQQDVYFQNMMMLTINRFKNPEIIFHSYGHKPPSALGIIQKKKLIAFLFKQGFSKPQTKGIKSKL